MVRINLLPQEFIEREVRRKINIFIIFGVSVIISVFVLFLFVRIGIERTVSAKLAYYEVELKKCQKTVDEINKLKEMTNILEGRKKVIEDLMERRLIYPKFIEEFLKLLPDSVWISSLNTSLIPQGFKVTINCFSFDNFGIADLISNFEKHPKFRNIELSGISTNIQGNYEILQFQVSYDYII